MANIKILNSHFISFSIFLLKMKKRIYNKKYFRPKRFNKHEIKQEVGKLYNTINNELRKIYPKREERKKRIYNKKYNKVSIEPLKYPELLTIQYGLINSNINEISPLVTPLSECNDDYKDDFIKCESADEEELENPYSDWHTELDDSYYFNNNY